MKYVVVVQGTLKDPANAQAAHDAGAAAARPAGKALGNISHHPYINPKNPKEFFDVDEWDGMEGIDKFFNDPVMGAEFAKLFEARPTISVYEDRGWYRW